MSYLALLIASHAVRWSQSDFSPRPDQEWISLPLFDSDGIRTSEKTANISFVDSGPGEISTPVDTLSLATVSSRSASSRPTVFLLHGSPAGSRSMMQMHRAMSESGDFRVITPDLPGFEGSSKRVPDYSVRAHARYLSALMDSLQIETAHLVGYSMSGGVVIEAMRLWPDRISSVTLLSGIGVQELELLGDYYLNHSIHGLQYAGLWLLSEAFPHFGWMDDAFLSVQYARNFYDTDQRPFRGILSDWQKPLFILHGALDPLVPYPAAEEHYRIVPQSEFVTFDDQGHGIPFQDAERGVEVISAWITKVENGEGITREDAEPQRISAAAKPFDASSAPPAEGFSRIILMFLIALATMISEDLASISAGLMAARGTFEFKHALFAAFAGILIGDILLYLSGRFLGRRIVTMAPFSWFIDARKLERGAAWFEHRGARVIIASRFIPGSRLPAYVAAGVLKAPFWKFLGYFLIATVIWTPFIVGISTLLGQQILDLWAVYESYALLVLVGLLLLLYAILHIGIPAFSHRGRRKLLSSWHRLTRWEFWSPVFFYPPVILRILRLAYRHRSLMVFTSANPGIESGGFLGESKREILKLMDSTPAMVARWVFIGSGQNRLESALSSMRGASLEFPVVLKPDIGDRGHNVRIVKSEADLAAYLAAHAEDTIIQEYLEGEEFGIFFIKHPGEKSGTIISITQKEMISVTGNGKDTLEMLILDDDRAVSMSPLFFRRHASKLSDIIPDGTRFQLVSVGTHSRGALFLDGGYLLSSELEDAFNKLARPMDGFFFGRFDLRVPSGEHLRQGEDFKIMEVNGVTSEVTHIYDPSTPLKVAYQELDRQWKLAFEIGRANVRLGHKPMPLRDAIIQIFKFKIRPKSKPDSAESALFEEDVS